jgi:hypothetical protein
VIYDRQAMTQIGVVGARGANAGEFDIVHHMAVDSNGNLYTAEIVNNRRAQKFVLAGTQ